MAFCSSSSHFRHSTASDPSRYSLDVGLSWFWPLNRMKLGLLGGGGGGVVHKVGVRRQRKELLLGAKEKIL